MSTITWVSAIVLAFATGAPVAAQGLTEHRFLDDALTNHPDIAAAEAALAAATGHRQQAAVPANPALSWEREDPDREARQDTWRLSWRLPLDGRRHRLAGAEAAAAASRATLEETRFSARLQLRELFAAWYLARERERILEHSLAEGRRLAAWLQARTEQGEAAGVEARRLALEAEVLARRHAEAAAAAMARQAAVAAWSDLVQGGTRPEQPLLPAPPPTVDVAGRADLVALEHRVSEAEAAQRLHRRVLEPPEISVGWLELHDAGQTLTGPVLGITWPVPVLDRRRGARQAAAAEVERHRATRAAAHRRATQQAAAALAAYAELHRAVTDSSPQTPATEVVEPVLAAFEAGEASLTDLLDTLRTTVEVELARLETLAAALQAERDLEAAIGRAVLPGASS